MMLLKDAINWKAVHLGDRTILRKDLGFLSNEQVIRLLNADVKPRRTPGHYEIVRM